MGNDSFDAIGAARQAATELARSPSFQVRTEAESIIAALSREAQGNVTGPEARVCRYIRSRLGQVTAQLSALEARLRTASSGTATEDIRREIATLVQAFFNELSAHLVAMRQEIEQSRGESGFQRILQKLPRYLRESVQRRGVSLGPVPGALRPFRLSPLNERSEAEGGGEVFPRGSRSPDRPPVPDGLEWVLRF